MARLTRPRHRGPPGCRGRGRADAGRWQI